ncbi:hypothetical protein [Leucobacter sp. OH1287]|uniref:hypothetical protein n=1 Tax=Leucobacter sp. OH1287 TaxID=2491049 RepID=UPI000F5DF1F8|nr:hypothetical protein [Leucobacter sp. OH1287]RRD60679.1 hypothetical protein EII30_05350 [Leucobacter sp. OH1287]
MAYDLGILFAVAAAVFWSVASLVFIYRAVAIGPAIAVLPYALIASVMVGACFILSKEASQADPYWTVTILLALIFWKEKPSITQTVGLVVTLAAVAFLSLNYSG